MGIRMHSLVTSMTLTMGVQPFWVISRNHCIWHSWFSKLSAAIFGNDSKSCTLIGNVIWGSKTTHHIPLRLVMHLSSFQSTLQTNGKTTVTVLFVCLSVCCWWFFPIKCHLLKTLSETFHLWVTLLLFTDVKEVPSVCL